MIVSNSTLGECQEVYNQVKMAKAYISITDNTGPDIQLMSFINYDSSVCDMVGLESFNSLSLSAQHEILMNGFNKLDLNTIALESLSEILLKVGTYVGGAALGFIRGQIGKAVVMGGVSVGAVLIGKIRNRDKVEIDKDPSVIRYQSIDKLFKLFDEILKIETIISKEVPYGFELDSWVKFKTDTFDVSMNQFRKLIDDYSKEKDDLMELVPFVGSGWTPSTLKSTTSRLIKSDTDLDNAAQPYSKKISTIRQWVSKSNNDELEVADIIHATIGHSISTFEQSSAILHIIQRNLNKVGLHYEEVE